MPNSDLEHGMTSQGHRRDLRDQTLDQEAHPSQIDRPRSRGVPISTRDFKLRSDGQTCSVLGKIRDDVTDELARRTGRFPQLAHPRSGVNTPHFDRFARVSRGPSTSAGWANSEREPSPLFGRYAIRETLRENLGQSRKPVGRFENVVGDVPGNAWGLFLAGREIGFGVVRERVFE